MPIEREQQFAKLRQKWRTRIIPIGDQVRALAQGDEYFRGSMATLEESGHPTNPIYSWIKATYGRDVSVGLRRVLDRTGRTWSLWRLLGDIKKHAAALSRQDFVESYTEQWPGDDGWTRTANTVFSRLVGGDHESLPRAEAQRDLDLLDRAFTTPGLRRLTDIRIVHFNPEEDEPSPATWNEVHEAVRTVQEVCWRYDFLLTQAEVGGKRMWWPEPDLDRWLTEFWVRPPRTKRGPGRPRKAPKKVSTTGGRRTADDVAAVGTTVLAHVTANPGQRLEEIGRALGEPTKGLKRPIANMLVAGLLRTEGQKRGTKYFVGSGAKRKA